MLKQRKWILLLVSCVCMLLFTGCDSEAVTMVVGDSDKASSQELSDKEVEEKIEKNSEDTYNQVFDKYGPQGTEINKEGKGFIAYVSSWAAVTYNSARKAAPYIGAGSFIMGLLLFLFARGNKRIRKFGLFTLMIGVPILLIVFVYGVGYLKHMMI